MTDDELKQLAKDLYAGKIFTSNQLRKNDIPGMVFMPLMFLSEEQNEKIKDVTLIYEYLDKAGPRSVNGYPSFHSMNYLRKEDHEKVIEYFNKVKQVIESI